MHPYQGNIFADLEFSDSYNEDSRGQPTILIQNPRWCDKCATNRGRAIFVLHGGRRREFEASPRTEDTVKKDRVHGVRDGRIAALKVPFASIEKLRMVDKVGELADMMKAVELGPREQGQIEKKEDVIEMFRKANIDIENEVPEAHKRLEKTRSHAMG